ncbi:MAG: Holliday junction branch migration protein RuvA [Proteobacteria bacterium]|nr:Holliday junction branch migration protein RuvA [Pseudomonadota bacterium]
MIARIEGVLFDKAPTRVVVDVRGVGYELFVPLTTFTALPDVGKTVALYVHTHVREEALQLYGFATPRERALFELLLKASRVGPKLAQTLLSGLPTEALVAAIGNGDAQVLRRVPGVGGKTAERIVVELRDRMDELLGADAGASLGGTPSEDVREQALSALLNLGTPRGQAERVVEAVAAEVGEEARVEDWIRAALRGLSR